MSKKNIVNFIFFMVVFGLTIYTVFSSFDFKDIVDGLGNLSVFSIIFAMILSMLFVIFEAIILKYLSKFSTKMFSLKSSIKYVLTGYFYSSITPSASGGQPMQVYAMVKDKTPASEATAILTIMGFYYKLVMVLMGVLLSIFYFSGITLYFKEYIWVFYMGLSLNLVVLFIILLMMIKPVFMQNFLIKICDAFVRIKLMKYKKQRKEKIIKFISDYKTSVKLSFVRKRDVVILIILTFFERSMLMLIPVVIAIGLPLENVDLITVFLLQMASYVAVDMLPLPGAQGISEIIFITTLSGIFTTVYVSSAMVLTRSISFYILLTAGLLVVLFVKFKKRAIKGAN